MIAAVKPSCPNQPTSACNAQFLAMLPAIVTQAKIAFRYLRGDARQDAIEETVANSFVAFVALAAAGRTSIAYPSVLARYAVAQIREGCRVGGRLRVNDVLAGYAQRRKGFAVERLDYFDPNEGCWTQALVEDRTAGPADTARVRIDFAAWLGSLSWRDRRIAERLATGHRTGEVAIKFGLSQGRVSQLRRELATSWEAFQSENRTESNEKVHA